MKTKTVLGVLSALALLSPAQAAAKTDKSGRQCFLADNVTNFAADDEDVVNVRVNAKDVFQFEMFGPCPEITSAQGIAIKSRGSSWICSGFDAELVVPSTIGPRRCQVRTVRKLSPAEITALPKRGRP